MHNPFRIEFFRVEWELVKCLILMAVRLDDKGNKEKRVLRDWGLEIADFGLRIADCGLGKAWGMEQRAESEEPEVRSLEKKIKIKFLSTTYYWLLTTCPELVEGLNTTGSTD